MIDADTSARFWSKVARGLAGDCWPWQAALSKVGYGKFWLAGRTLGAHRIAYTLVKGPIPDALSIDHLCRNRACVNPDHLEAVPIKVNILRGEGRPARNHRKTACKNGHPFTSENTYLNPKGERICRACMAEYQRRWQERNREHRNVQSQAWREKHLTERRAYERLYAARKRNTSPEARAAYNAYMRDYTKKQRQLQAEG